jgi:hypothetical protein
VEQGGTLLSSPAKVYHGRALVSRLANAREGKWKSGHKKAWQNEDFEV